MKAVVEPIGDVAEVKSEWATLYETAAANFYLSPAWMFTWLDRTAGANPRCVVRVRDEDGDLVAIGVVGGPIVRGWFRFVEARLNETGAQSIDRIYIEYNDLLIGGNLNEASSMAARIAAINAVVRAMPDVEEFVFRNATPALAAAVERACRDFDLYFETARAEPTYQMPLNRGDWSVFEPASSSLRAKLRRSEKLYREGGEVRLSLAASQSEKQTAWRDLNDLHNAAWRRRGVCGALENADVRGFLEEMLANFPASVELLRLTAGERTLGVLLNFVEGRVARNYQSGFAFDDDNRLAPGFLAHAMAAAHYQHRGFETYDLLAGDLDYKTRLGDAGDVLKTLTLTRKGVKLTMRNLTATIRRRLANDAGKRQT